MTGVVRRNSDRQMFIHDGQLILKRLELGNVDQRFPQTNDWILGDVGNGTIAIMGKYKNGTIKDPVNYEIDSEIDTNNFPDI